MVVFVFNTLFKGVKTTFKHGKYLSTDLFKQVEFYAVTLPYM